MRETLTLRPATEDDAVFLRALRNEPAVVAASRTSQPVDEATHREWLEGSIDSSARRLLVACKSGVPIGQARLDAAGDGEWVSIAFLPEQRGQGHGGEVLRVLQHVAHQDLLAEVRAGNASSLGLFLGAGFEQTGVDGGFIQLRWTYPIEHEGAGLGAEIGVSDHAD